ncbi:50S ribosomal protein L10 [Candidatus Adlerbacteria bacterium RIFOXYC1_FULL_48_26]|uniref:Large ribosomal subunit protein uL10 n=1 Tax=Candidatus Adlerbacteria bacterium RIFOXYC1_FULL_48_26 TaxID=1797247 RepID=A0A1F4Y2H2_9BACT|nr:MAG: 50S ribosomal protein L10 [Candidatus Adlerbacteria bacterium RIFOXYC1_FULL_48_26]OGC94550.1 MAG: 50S ribosomal protein L10 [Candidatus Adlerbacteria bacterium RIFOXYB1_FULL_48_10]OGC95968.1 MAG: 50S ribosomal protein L10 [Candidatus Adlerbacteria bacterium RIFOXYD1_FULL_48_8]
MYKGIYFAQKDMAITKQKKVEITEKVSAIIKDSSTLVFAKFKGLPVSEQTELRRALRAADVSYTVAKKTLMRRALDAAKFEGTAPELEGEIALVSGRDELAPARELAVFVKKFSEHLSFAGGVFGGKYMTADEIKSIAAIPGLETLRAMFAQIINSPRQRFAVALNEVAKLSGTPAPAPVEQAEASAEVVPEAAPAEVVEAPAETPTEAEATEQTS